MYLLDKMRESTLVYKHEFAYVYNIVYTQLSVSVTVTDRDTGDTSENIVLVRPMWNSQK